MRARRAVGASTSVSGAPRERDRPLLLGELLGKLRRRRDSRLERGAAIRRKRPVRERRQLGELLTAGRRLDDVSSARQHER